MGTADPNTKLTYRCSRIDVALDEGRIDDALYLLQTCASDVALYWMFKHPRKNREDHEAYLQQVSDVLQMDVHRNCELFGNVINVMLRNMQDEAEIRSYFYWHSPVYKAIEHHIEKCDENECAFFDKSQVSLYYRRGSGPVSFRSAQAFSPSIETNPSSKKGESCYVAVPAKVFGMTIEVHTYDKDADDEGQSLSFDLRVPVELEQECTVAVFNARFNLWLAEYREERLKKAATNDEKKLKELAARNPKLFKKIAKEL